MTSPDFDMEALIGDFNQHVDEIDRNLMSQTRTEIVVEDCISDLLGRLQGRGIDTDKLDLELGLHAADSNPAATPLHDELDRIVRWFHPVAKEAFILESKNNLDAETFADWSIADDSEDLKGPASDNAFRLIAKYGETATVELRELTDQLVGQGCNTAAITDLDRHVSADGQEYTSVDESIQKSNRIKQVMLPVIEEVLREQLGDRDNSARHAGLLILLTELRATRGPAFILERQIAELHTAYPDTDKLAGVIIAVGKTIKDMFPDEQYEQDERWLGPFLEED